MTSTDRRTYQMLWDCPSCGTCKLLGLTHRFCPNCGAPQDPTLRYFPPQDEAIAVEDHPLVGPDWRCSGCDAPNHARATFCGACGAPRSGDRPVALRHDVVSTSGAAFQGETAADAKRDLAPPSPPSSS